MASIYIAKRKTSKGQDRWHVRCETGRVAADGQRSALIHLGAFKSEREAKARRDWARMELAAGRIPDRHSIVSGGVKVQDAVDAWVASLLDLAPVTLTMYRQRAGRVADDFGGRVMARITPRDVQAWIVELSEEEGFAPGTVAQYVKTLRMILDHAGLVPNPARDSSVRLPRGAGRSRFRLRSRVELAKVREALDEKYWPVQQLLERGGLRIGEFESARAYARRVQVVGKGGKPRWVDDLGDLYGGDGALLEGLSLPLSLPRENAWSAALDAAIRDAGVPHFSSHDLRHLHASRMLHAGMPPATLAARLGHANPGILMRHYVHEPPPD
jgi:integrase